ncbi:MAG: hypothetical protein V3R54_06705, partial [Thermodesulfovibrionia bacterium]
MKSLILSLLWSVVGIAAATMFFMDAGASDEIPDYFVPPPPFSEGIFPCSECHADMEVNTVRRELEFHTEIKLKHAE